MSFIEINIGEQLHPTVRISDHKEHGDIATILDDLIIPALLASGFDPETVARYIQSQYLPEAGDASE